jgi:hypothetical protein
MDLDLPSIGSNGFLNERSGSLLPCRSSLVPAERPVVLIALSAVRQ